MITFIEFKRRYTMISKRIFFVLMLFLFSTSSLYSLEFAVGAKAGYYFWIPYFKEIARMGGDREG
jgi:hypothetical protein